MAIHKETVSRRLTELREAHADPQTGKPLAQEKAAGRVGVTVRQWQRWENGDSIPYPRNLSAIAEEFAFDVNEFFDEPEPAQASNGTPDPFAARPATREDVRRLEAKLDLIIDALHLHPQQPEEPVAQIHVQSVLETERPAADSKPDSQSQR